MSVSLLMSLSQVLKKVKFTILEVAMKIHAIILEIINLIENKTKIKHSYEYTDENRIGDHICYYSNLFQN